MGEKKFEIYTSMRCFLLILISFLLFSCRNASAQSEDVAIIEDRIRSDFLGQTLEPDSVISYYLDGIGETGAYPDIDYDSHEQTAWAPIYHLERLMQLAGAYISEQSEYYASELLYNKVVLALSFYMDISPWSTNWYKGQIWEPKDLGMICILMNGGLKKLPQSLVQRIIHKWENCGADPANKSSTDRTEVAQHWVYFSCILENTEQLSLSLNYIFEPLKYNGDEGGIQIDNSYLEHGNQLYIGGYGIVFLDIILKFAKICMGTKFALNNGKIEILRKYMVETVASVIRGKYMNFNCHGRSIARANYMNYESMALSFMMLKEIDDTKYFDYDLIISRLLGKIPAGTGVEAKHIHFFRGDYTIHNREKYNCSVRMVSNRTIRNETMSNENIKGYYISDGATTFSVFGDEYFNIFPLWDWSRLPGVTAPQIDPMPRTYGFNVPGTSTFSGGVSDSIYGVSAYKYFDIYQNVNTGANKGWFFFDDEIVCLGSNINSDYESLTTINQCWGSPQFACSSFHGNSNEYNGEVEGLELKNVKTVYHNNVGYILPYEQDLIIENILKEGRWTDINTSGNQNDSIVRGKVFSLSINHHLPHDDSYAYIVVPGVSQKQLETYVDNCPISIVNNSDSIQAVYHRGLDMLGAIFYKSSSLLYEDVVINVDRPCVVLLKNLHSPERLIVHMSDPSQSGAQITMKVKYLDRNCELEGTCILNKEATPGMNGVSEILYMKQVSSSINTLRCDDIQFERIGKCLYYIKISPNLKGKTTIAIFDMQGKTMYNTLVKNNCIIKLPAEGLYLIKYKNTKSSKLFAY